MTTHNLVGRHSRKHLHIISGKNVFRPSLCHPRIIPNVRRLGVNFLLLLILGPLPFTPLRRNLLNWSGRRSRPHRFDSKNGWCCCSDGNPLFHHSHALSPKIGQRFILLSPHLSIHSLVKFSSHSCKRKTLKKRKKKEQQDQHERA